MAKDPYLDKKLRNQRIAEVTPEVIEEACRHPGVNEMYHSILEHSGYNCAKMYIWVAYVNRGKGTRKPMQKSK
jgi:hypothetical protein